MITSYVGPNERKVRIQSLPKQLQKETVLDAKTVLSLRLSNKLEFFIVIAEEKYLEMQKSLINLPI